VRDFGCVVVRWIFLGGDVALLFQGFEEVRIVVTIGPGEALSFALVDEAKETIIPLTVFVCGSQEESTEDGKNGDDNDRCQFSRNKHAASSGGIQADFVCFVNPVRLSHI
jgi:hypothetical protein